ncbi:MAG: MBL fold metallo-hydrolase [Ruminococcaceae bacterium]|nr:MBL fold metallo-hydrolase [Oscillospiraceae bacterium]
MAKRKQKFSSGLTVFLCIVTLVAGCVIGYLGAGAFHAATFKSDEAPKTLVQGEMQIHFLELGNKYTGDCTYIKIGDTDILIDAGSKISSIGTISDYIDDYVGEDKKLEYVIVTHAHQDHYAGFTQLDGSLFDLYEVGTIIDFALSNQEDKGKKNMYGCYLLERADEIAAGAKHYTAAECIEQNMAVFDLGSGATMTILDSYYYYEENILVFDDNGDPVIDEETGEQKRKDVSENDYSVCTLFTYGEYNYLFTGDLEEDGEEKLVQMNTLPEVDLYKAGHHGSKTSSSDALLSVIKPDIVCVCCCAGSSEYTDTNANQFPTQQFIDRVAPYTDKVYVTTLCVDYKAGTFRSMNGNITVLTDKNGLSVICGSGDSRVLKEWEWFKQNRTCPEAWR